MTETDPCECTHRLSVQIRKVGESIIDAGTILPDLRCEEAMELFTLFALAGHADIALQALLDHAAGDNDENDAHHDLYLTLHTAAEVVRNNDAFMAALNVYDETMADEETLPHLVTEKAE